MRGGPPPAWLNLVFQWSYLGPIGLQAGHRVSRQGFGAGPFWKVLGHFFAIFSHFFDFFRFLGASCAILHFFNDFFRFFEILNRFREVSGEILKGFFDDFWHVFRKIRFCEN